MVDEGARAFRPIAIPVPRLSEVAYVGFLLLIFVGLTPFAVRDTATLVGGENGSGAGSLLRQLSYAAIFGPIVYAGLREKGARAFAGLSPLLALLLVWCAVSAAWSPEPEITLRRAALAAIVTLSALMSVSTVGFGRSMELLRWVLGIVLIVDWCSIPLVHQAVHLAGDPEPSLVGDWRGLYFHKNIAGAVSAITAILFFFAAWDKRKILHLALCAGAVAFTVMTRSKSSLALLPVALAAGAVYRVAWPRAIDRMIAATLAGIVLVLGITLALGEQSLLAHLFSDPKAFTGRAEIWQAELAFIQDHPYLGAGFGTFSDTGALSPLHRYVQSDWVYEIAHGHNAYLQLLVTIGGVGFVLAMSALVAAPLVSFWRVERTAARQMALAFAVFVFVVLHNILESDFLEGDSAAWVAFLLMLAGLRIAGTSKQRPQAVPTCPPR